MANSDNTFGTHNKVTYVWTQTDASWNLGHPSSIALSNPCRVVSAANHGLTDASKVTFADIVGTTELNGNTYYAKKINDLHSEHYFVFTILLADITTDIVILPWHCNYENENEEIDFASNFRWKQKTKFNCVNENEKVNSIQANR